MAKPESWGIAALRSISDGVITTNLKGMVTFMNPAAETLTGWQQEEVLGKDLSDIFHLINTETTPPIKSLFTKAVQEGIIINQEEAVYLALGDKKISIAHTIAPLRDEKEKIIGVVLTIRDVTKHKQMIDELKANAAAIALENARLYRQVKKELAEQQNVAKELRWVSARNQTIINAIPDSLFYLNRNGEILDFRLKHNLPLIYEKLAPGINLSEVFNLASNYKVHISHYIAQALDSGEMQTFEFKLPWPEGGQDIEARLVAQGPDEVLAIIRNITKRKRAEEALKKSEANLRALFNSSRQAFVFLGQHGEIQAFNEAAREGAEMILGIRFQEGGSIYELVSEEDAANLKQIFNRVLKGETVSIERLLTIDGTDNWFEYNYSPVFADGGQVIGVCFSTIDIDARKKAVDKLSASEERLLKELESVLFTTEALVSDFNLTNLLEFITTQARYLTNSNGAIVLLLNEAGQHLEVVRSSMLKAGTKLSIQDSLAEFVIKYNESYISNHALSDERTESVRRLLHPIEVRSLFCIPLKVRNKPQGILLIWSQDEEAFIDQNTPLIHLFANQAALAIYNANLHIRNRQSAIEHERQRLARELHDTVSKSLFAIGMLAQAAVRRLDQTTNFKIQEAVKDIHQLSQTGLIEIRRQIYYLQPATLADKHLNEALKQFCNTLSKQFGFSVDLLIDPAIQLSTYQEENLYYIAKEALWNVVKHAGDTHAKLTLVGSEGYITLRVVDEGCGFVVSNFAQAEMVGLRSIQERAEVLGGTFKLQSTPGSGTRITVQIPL
jgi:PAS domain S-box-containing protein